MGKTKEKELTNKALKDIIKAKKELKEGKGQKIERLAEQLGIIL